MTSDRLDRLGLCLGSCKQASRLKGVTTVTARTGTGPLESQLTKCALLGSWDLWLEGPGH